ncbi:hypothetical protein PFISCL1PPCAC_21366, partial [Pristionchus fissidentatus]
SVDDLALAFRQNLQPSLMLTNTLMAEPRSASEFLLGRMGAVLSTVVGTNFGRVSHSRIDDLYTAIDDVQDALFDSCFGIAFVHFARAFAVVLEESVARQREEGDECRRDDAIGSDDETTDSVASVKTWKELQQLQHDRLQIQQELQHSAELDAEGRCSTTTPTVAAAAADAA